jgi:hypothetical protein
MEVKVFISYSHKDEEHLKILLEHLKVLQSEGISFWWDDAIVTGDDWNEKIKEEIEESHIALLLISQSFLDSEYIANQEVANFLEQHQGDRFVIFPVILSECKWYEHEWLKSLQLPAGGKALVEHYSDPERLESLLQEIRQDLETQAKKVKESIKMPQNLRSYRNRDREKAVIFVHDLSVSWEDFPRFLVEDERMDDWNVFSYGYSPRIRRRDLIFKRDRPFKDTAQMLRTACFNPPLNQHSKIALIAHSIAGVIVQLLILESDDFTERVSDVILFGTPSRGMPDSGIYSFFQKRLNVSSGGKFIEDLRDRWDKKFSEGLPFSLLTIAGENDQYVPSSSSLEPFPSSPREMIPGDHYQIIHPLSKNEQSVQKVIRTLVSDDYQSRAKSAL